MQKHRAKRISKVKVASMAAPDAATINRFVFCLLLCVAAYFLLSGVAHATPAEDTPMGDVLCAVVGFFYGNLGRGLATLGIIVVGVGALLGKVSWGMAATVGIGISIIFNAETIAGALNVGAGNC